VPTLARSTFASLPRPSAVSMHAGDRCTYAPLPDARPVGSTSIAPDGLRTTRTIAAFASCVPQPAHVRCGSRPLRTA